MTINRLERIDSISAPRKTAPFVISILSGKGGAGKSVIAFNLASELARRQFRTVILDADWHFGNQHILANVAPQATLYDLIYPERSRTTEIAPVNEYLRMAAAASLSEAADSFPEADFARLLSNLRRLFASYDFLVLDTASGIVELVALAASASDLNLIIINPELTAIADGYGLFKYILKANRQLTVHILNNRVKNAGEAQYIYQKFSYLTERFLRRVAHDAGYLLEDARVGESIGAQKPLFQLDEDSAAGQGIQNLARLVLRESGNFPQGAAHDDKEKINSHIEAADIKE